MFKYSSQGFIIDCLNPLASVQKQLIKANPGRGWAGGSDLASGDLSLIKMCECASIHMALLQEFGHLITSSRIINIIVSKSLWS